LNREEFRDLFDKRFDSIRNFIYYRCSDEDVASDVAQDVFTRIWEKGMNVHPDKDKNLLYKMASDMFISKLRHRKVELDFKDSLKVERNDVTPEEIVQYNQLLKRYSDALVQMGAGQREVFLMSRSEGLKYDEISKILGIGVKAVEKRMSLALSILKRKLGDNGKY
jgi:RNA polymerase sigma-70 factor (ECF subfamily)